MNLKERDRLAMFSRVQDDQMTRLFKRYCQSDNAGLAEQQPPVSRCAS